MRIKTQSSRDTVVTENRVSILDLILDSRFSIHARIECQLTVLLNGTVNS